MKRFYIYSYILTLVIVGCGPELRTVVERDKFNRIILEAELKGEVDTNWSNYIPIILLGHQQMGHQSMTQLLRKAT